MRAIFLSLTFLMAGLSSASAQVTQAQASAALSEANQLHDTYIIYEEYLMASPYGYSGEVLVKMTESSGYYHSVWKPLFGVSTSFENRIDAWNEEFLNNDPDIPDAITHTTIAEVYYIFGEGFLSQAEASFLAGNWAACKTQADAAIVELQLANDHLGDADYMLWFIDWDSQNMLGEMMADVESYGGEQ